MKGRRRREGRREGRERMEGGGEGCTVERRNGGKDHGEGEEEGRSG